MLMQRKISWLVAVMSLLVSLSWAAPASADDAYWSAEYIPDAMEGALGPAGIDIRDLAVVADGAIVYAVPGDSVSADVLYKSTDAGVSWTALDISVEAGLVAVAPDDADIVAVADGSSAEVCFTINGGSIWYSLGVPQESGGSGAVTVYDLAISEASDGGHYLAVAGKEAGAVANVWYRNLDSAAPAWKETRSLPGFSGANMVKAVSFSPDFSEDRCLVAITGNDNSSVKLQVFNLAYRRWNGSADFTGYPVTIVSDGGITGLDSASISLSPDYLAGDPDRRLAFVGLTVTGNAAAVAASGIYRLDDRQVMALKKNTGIHSLAYNGASLVAGSYGTTTVYRSADPRQAIPTVSDVYNMKAPGGEGRVVVAWAGSRVAAGTSGDESAFAVSGNSGAAFNDISLIDTGITCVRDVAVSADGSRVYLVTDDGTDLSLWRRFLTWERIFSRQSASDYIIRLAPGNAGAIYLAGKNGKTVYYNGNAGEAAWYTRSCQVNVQDLAVESDDVVYALDSSGSVSRSTNAGFIWEREEPTGLDSGATIFSVSAGNLLAGSRNGYVAYSTDGGLSWNDIPEVLESGAGRVQVIAGGGFASNRIIYAASDTAGQNIKKWQIGTSTAWTDIFRNKISGGVYGLAMDGDTLYALEYNSGTGQSTLWQCLLPAEATYISSSWSSTSTSTSTDNDDAEVHLNAGPRALKASSGKLWAVKTNGTSKLYSLTYMLKEVPLAKPALGFISRINAINGIADDVAFSWERISEATSYELQIALDRDFIHLVATLEVASEEATVFALLGPYQSGDNRVNFTAGTAYFWRVRATQPLYSRYSQVRSFTVEPPLALVPGLLAPANGGADVSRKPSFSWQPVAGASEYQFVLSDASAPDLPVINIKVGNAGFAMTEELDYGRTYFWKVRATESGVTDWSAVSNFTVEKEAAGSAPPLIIQSPTVVSAPEISPPAAVMVSLPSPPSSSVLTDFVRALAVMEGVLGLALIGLILWFIVARPAGINRGFGGGWWVRLRGKLAGYFEDFRPLAFRGIRARADGAGAGEARHPVSFAAESFLWMLNSDEKEANRVMSAEEEQSLGKILAAKIRALADDHLLYRKFPGDAVLFLYLWAHYGSRDETNRYLNGSFQSRPKNVTDFLKCYLNAPRGVGSDIIRSAGFSRTQYDLVTKVVDPENVFKTLKKLHGAGLEVPESGESGDASDKAVAFQFARCHVVAKPKEAGIM